MINKTFLTKQEPVDIFDLDYSNDSEICPEEACEIPRFDVDWNNGIPHPIAHDESDPLNGSPFLKTGEIDSSLVATLKQGDFKMNYVDDEERLKIVAQNEELAAVGRALASQIKNQDATKYKEWSEDTSRFNKETHKGIGRRLEHFTDYVQR